ncbi:CopG family transcriptional regulator [Shewanella sp.]|uniref:CopG family transcriptional regulator n=1 Tax=Shewanella sp. TaxID=50422 RepID=UPI002634C304|nr:CopG family transcriptional regulator [Shewanella sp.]
MGLSDLKKNAMPSRGSAQPLSLDEFIDAATRYAMGENLSLEALPLKSGADVINEAQLKVTLDSSNVVSLHRQTIPSAQLQPETAADQKPHDRHHYRKATFSLSEAAITHLTKLSAESETSKSKLIRFLIEQHYALPTALRQMREQQIKKS